MADDAPWYDPVRPVSGDFLGVMGGIVTGLTASTATRDPVEHVGDGSSIGPLRRAHREIQFTVTAIARSECALSYGMEWLSRSLSGDPCEASCNGQAMAMYACCPDDIPSEDFDSFVRNLFDVGILEGPTVTERTHLSDTMIWATVTFTLIAGIPWVYGDPLDTGEEWADLSLGGTVLADPDAVYQKCLPPVSCGENPDCPTPILPPEPPAPISPCYLRGVDTFKVSRIRIAAGEYPLWTELVPVVEINAAAQDLHRVLVRFWANPLDGSCDEELDPCDSCGDMNIGFVPAFSSLTIDGRTQRSAIECFTEDFGSFQSAPQLFGRQGGLFEYPFFPCPGGLCVEIWVPEQDATASAQARVLLVPRADVM